jgi:uncharacterized protein (TIGR02421 family)
VTELSAAELAVDRELASIGQSFRFLVDLTPVNVEEALKEFLESPDDPPRFVYRDLEDAPEVVGARLAQVDLTNVSDPTLAHLFEAKRRELRLQLDMLAARGRPEFAALSVELYGVPSPTLEEQATTILEQVQRIRSSGRRLEAGEVAAKALDHLTHYRRLYADLPSKVTVRTDVSGIMVAEGDLLIADTVNIPTSRLPSVIAHEVDTHILTFFNGSHQPLRLMAAGLAGFDETQEGLAVLSEGLVGGLTGKRLRQLAARVITVHRMVQGVTFPHVCSELSNRFGYSAPGAFMIAMRVYRGGGLTKDAVYLRGLQAVVEHVSSSESRSLADLSPMWVGKFSLIDLPLVNDLLKRAVLVRPALLPSFFDDPEAQERLQSIEHDAGLHALIGAQV